MAVLLSPVGGAAAQFLDNNGNPLLAGKLYTYVAGTTTNQATYTSSSGVTPHPNPIILDAGGRVPGGEIWLTDGLQYKFVLKNANDVLIGTYDNLVGINSNFVNFLTETEVQTATAGQTVFTLTTMQYQPGTNNLTVYVDGVNQIDGATYSYVETSSTVVTFTAGLHVGALVKFTTAQTLSTGVTDASLVTYQPPFTASVATTVEDKLAQTVSALDFGTGIAAIQAAIDSGAGRIYIPAGLWEYTGTVTYQRPAIRLAGNIELFGDGPGKTIIKQNAAYYLFGYGYLSTDGTPDPNDNIKNIIFRDMELVGDDTPVFSEFEYILQLGCVSNVMVDNVKFRGWRGDAISIGEALGSVERHQLDITIQNCYFDGVNKDNRQAITCTDGTNITIQNNIFVNCTRSDMPGNIDFEPNSGGAFPYDQWINNIHILNNRFSNSDAAAISVQLANVDNWTVPPGPIYISGNTIDTDVTTDMKLYFTASGGAATLVSSVPANIFVDNNYFSANGGSVIYGMNVLSITNNQFSNNFPSLTVGRTDLAYGQVVNANISGNSFKGKNTYQNIVFGQCNNVRIDNNRFETGNAPNANNIKFYGNGVTATCAAIQLSNNLFYRVAAYGAIDPVTTSGAIVTAWSVNNYQQEGWPINYHPQTFGTFEASSTPTVQENLPMVTSGTTPLTNFTNGFSSQVLTILALHATTVQNNANIKLNGAADYVMGVNDTLTLINYGGVWYELARSNN